MPTPDRTSLEEIVQAGRDILESAGLDGLTMQAVAARVGVRPPSLYKRVRNREDLIGLITEATARELSAELARLQAGGDVHAELAAMAHAFRAFAHARPTAFALIFGRRADQARPTVAALAELAAPLLRVTERLAGAAHALPAARTVTAWLYGFVTMELAGAFNLGGDVGEAFEFGIARLTETLAPRDMRQAP
ncbi:TetR/AcrR family transcriptional regulator [Dactylosporangium matsuzakiense]|uniref:TetR family transcriptional regulator n=1 Tax=Dactylosporangium matsuzakiense TaxID=53360 RepID=A0A9W6KPA9_9ACTN|nr:WHG domain-containing protein [Dactylosporangium matsuzakiense]UWZ41000.1 WHG domain-containing protein [Dactylosporangium matsuzakiense]GLL04792.1 TetR family transcriptional regulator [Dactylosporangium matsuzakiense]